MQVGYSNAGRSTKASRRHQVPKSTLYLSVSLLQVQANLSTKPEGHSKKIKQNVCGVSRELEMTDLCHLKDLKIVTEKAKSYSRFSKTRGKFGF